MAGVNLRVATLKNANLQNCDLRAAVLAGADLEVSQDIHCNLGSQNSLVSGLRCFLSLYHYHKASEWERN